MIFNESMEDFRKRAKADLEESAKVKPKYSIGEKVMTPRGPMIVVLNGSKSKITGGVWQTNYLCAFITSKGTANKKIRPITFQEDQLTNTP